MFVNGHAGNRVFYTMLSIKTPTHTNHVCEWSRWKYCCTLNGAEYQNTNPSLESDSLIGDLQSIEGASCAETDKQNVALVTTSNRAIFLLKICTCISLACMNILQQDIDFCFITKLLRGVVCMSWPLYALLGKRCSTFHIPLCSLFLQCSTLQSV